MSADRALSVAVHEPGRVNSGIRRYGEVLADGLRAHGGFEVEECPQGMGRGGRRGIGQALALARTLRSHDAVVLPYTRYHVVAPSATRLVQILLVWSALRRRTVTVLHDAYAPGSPRHVEWWAVLLVLALSGRVVIHSEHERVQIASVPLAHRAEVVPHFIVERPGLDRARARAQLGVAEDRTILGVVGWIQPRKNYELAIEALARLDPQVELWFVGGAGLGQEGYVESLERLARSRGVRERLLVTGALPEAEFERRLAALDVGLCPYRRISASGSLSTLLGARRPVIASDVPFVRELASLGPDVVHTFHRPDAAALAATVTAVLAGPPAAPDAFDALLASRSVAATAARYAALLQAVVRRPCQLREPPPGSDGDIPTLGTT